MSPENQAALRDHIMNKPLQMNNHPEKLGGEMGKTYSFLQGFAERTHRLLYYLQTKNLAQIHLRKAIKSFPYFQN